MERGTKTARTLFKFARFRFWRTWGSRSIDRLIDQFDGPFVKYRVIFSQSRRVICLAQALKIQAAIVESSLFDRYRATLTFVEHDQSFLDTRGIATSTNSYSTTDWFYINQRANVRHRDRTTLAKTIFLCSESTYANWDRGLPEHISRSNHHLTRRLLAAVPWQDQDLYKTPFGLDIIHLHRHTLHSIFDAAPVMDWLLLEPLYKAARRFARNSRLDPSFIVLIALIGTLFLISILIMLLVWLRYLVIAGLITTSAVTAVRWKRGEIEIMSENAGQEPPVIDVDDSTILEHDLEMAGPD
ncbi:hypothetical protein MMC29_007531 [Sticta canariensis]|nr:hypothetical protein [Sticta canariensis]